MLISKKKKTQEPPFPEFTECVLPNRKHELRKRKMCDSENKGSSPRAVGREAVRGKSSQEEAEQEAQRAPGRRGREGRSSAKKSQTKAHTGFGTRWQC